MPINDKLHLIMMAAHPLDVGDELLFDYNNRESSMQFLNSCPVCSNDLASSQQPHTADVSSRNTFAGLPVKEMEGEDVAHTHSRQKKRKSRKSVEGSVDVHSDVMRSTGD